MSGHPPTIVTYSNAWWQKIDGKYYFLHSGGGIGENGNNPSVRVELSDRLVDIALEDPANNDELRSCVQASLSIYNISSLGPHQNTLGFTYLAPLSHIIAPDVSLFISGESGSLKSCASALAQGHVGKNYYEKHLPTNWHATSNYILALAHKMKNCPTVIDDLNPKGSSWDVALAHKKAEEVFRAAGNQGGRGRLNQNSTMKATAYPRGVLIASGEDIPKGHSLRARLWIEEVHPNDVNSPYLAKLQSDAKKGVFTKAMSGYIRWLALK